MKTDGSIAQAAPVDAFQYGRTELKRVLHKNFMVGFAISVVLHALALGCYFAVLHLGDDDDNLPVVKVRMLKYSDLGPPPSISAIPLPPPVGVAAAVKPSVGMPVPVPDAEVSAEQTLATQQELSNTPSPALEDFGANGNVQIEKDIQIEGDEPGMDEFVPVEKGPQIVKQVVPIYPDMARRAGLEGVVWVKILVGKDGKPVKVAVAKSSTEIFEEPALEAARQFLFTPAVMNNGPVKVWVSVPFRFKLKDTSS